jgi:hypothetical protein
MTPSEAANYLRVSEDDVLPLHCGDLKAEDRERFPLAKPWMSF